MGWNNSLKSGTNPFKETSNQNNGYYNCVRLFNAEPVQPDSSALPAFALAGFYYFQAPSLS